MPTALSAEASRKIEEITLSLSAWPRQEECIESTIACRRTTAGLHTNTVALKHKLATQPNNLPNQKLQAPSAMELCVGNQIILRHVVAAVVYRCTRRAIRQNRDAQ